MMLLKCLALVGVRVRQQFHRPTLFHQRVVRLFAGGAVSGCGRQPRAAAHTRRGMAMGRVNAESAMKTIRWTFFAASVAPLAACASAPKPDLASKAPIRHVFVIVLENEPFEVTFHENSIAPYLAHELPRQGALLTNCYAIGHLSLDNYIAMISGQ